MSSEASGTPALASDRTASAGGRACFLLRVRPDRLEPYLEAHRHVWPEMQDALRRAGWHDYSLFLDRITGLVVGTVRADDFAAAQARMGDEDVNTRWQAAMGDWFAEVDERVAPGELVELEEYFHLECSARRAGQR